MVKKKKVSEKDAWFKKEDGSVKKRWGFIPIHWEGWIALVLLVALNVFAANYFDVMNAPFRDVSKFLVVLLLSLVVFIIIAKKRTKGVEVSKDTI